MAAPITTNGVHHLTLTVTDVERAHQFYSGLLGFQVVATLDPKILLSDGRVMLVLAPAPDPTRAAADDRFDENRVGLDHLSFSVDSRDDPERAIQRLDERGVPHGELKDLGPDIGLYVLAFRDPDNIQLELTASYS